MRSITFPLLVCVLAFGLPAGRVAGQDSGGLSRDHHAWGRFDPGAWKLVRVTTETLDDKGQVVTTSTTESKTSLVQVDETSVTLCVEVLVEVAGKRFDAAPQTIKQEFHGELVSPGLKVRHAGQGQVTIDGRKIPCQIDELESSSTTGKTVSRVYCSDSVAPFVLRRESTTTDLDKQATINSILSDVIAQGMPCKVLGEIKSATYIKTVQQYPKGTITTLATNCDDVPGGVVSQSVKETDPAGRLVRRCTLDLVSYGLEPEVERPGLFSRKHSTRSRKASPSRSGSY